MFSHMDDKPKIDYCDLPAMPRDGIHGRGNSKFLTRSLFLETCEPENYEQVVWCLSEHEVYCPALKRWIPSAWMAYIYADDEYDALRKICGNVRQWEAIKKMTTNQGRKMVDVIADWQAEQALIQRSALRQTLLRGALSGSPGYTAAAKMLLQMIDAPIRGRPKKDRTSIEAEKEEAHQKGAAADAARLADL